MSETKHWIKDDAQRTSFWKAVNGMLQNCGIKAKDRSAVVHDALGVEHIEESVLSPANAMRYVKCYLMHLHPDKFDKPEPDERALIEQIMKRLKAKEAKRDAELAEMFDEPDAEQKAAAAAAIEAAARDAEDATLDDSPLGDSHADPLAEILGMEPDEFDEGEPVSNQVESQLMTEIAKVEQERDALRFELEALKRAEHGAQDDPKPAQQRELIHTEAPESVSSTVVINGFRVLLTGRAGTDPEHQVTAILNLLRAARMLRETPGIIEFGSVHDERDGIQWFKRDGVTVPESHKSADKLREIARPQVAPPASSNGNGFKPVHAQTPAPASGPAAAAQHAAPATAPAAPGELNVEQVAFVEKVFSQKGAQQFALYPVLGNGKPGERPSITLKKPEEIAALAQYMNVEALEAGTRYTPVNGLTVTWKRGRFIDATQTKRYRDFVSLVETAEAEAEEAA